MSAMNSWRFIRKVEPQAVLSVTAYCSRKTTSGGWLSGVCDGDLLSRPRHSSSFRSLVAPLLRTGHFLGVLPVESSSEQPRFTWMSLRALFSLAVTTAVLFRILLYGYNVYMGHMTFMGVIVSRNSRFGFNVMAFLELVLFLRLATRWRSLLLCLLRMEELVPPDSDHLRDKLRPITFTVIIGALGEFILQQTTVPLPRPLENYTSVHDVLRDHYAAVYLPVSKVFSYNVPLLLFAEGVTLATNFVLNYNDAFVIIVSTVIAQRFRSLHANLRAAVEEELGVFNWREARVVFNSLTKITRELDQHVSPLVLLSCMNNLFSLCVQLQHTVSPAAHLTATRQFHYLYSFVFVLLRASGVVYAASRVDDETKTMKRELFSVPASSYNEEVERFITQVTTDDVTLTGLGLFSVNRSFILKMMGTIATYEVLLVQMYHD